jgi:nucleotide-binding universal stress UspA family protein
MYRTILVPLDGSTFSEHALPLALHIAQRAGAVLQAIHVHVPIGSAYAGSELASDLRLDSLVREREHAYLDYVAKRLACVSLDRMSTALLDGSVADTVREHAVATGTDLIVMTTHGRGPLSRFWLGGVADRIIRHVPMPVLLVRPQDSVPDLSCKPLLQRVLIPLDGSELAEQILEPALELGGLMQAEYLLLRVVEPVPVLGYDISGFAMEDAEKPMLRQLEDEAQIYLERVAERLRDRSLHVQTKVLVQPSVAGAILNEARAHASNLIALATHGRGGLARLLLGSVADKVLRGAATPVLVYRPLNK